MPSIHSFRLDFRFAASVAFFFLVLGNNQHNNNNNNNNKQIVVVVAAAAEEPETCEACLFDGSDTSSCVIYGKVDDQVVNWSLGTDSCKDNYNIFISSIDPEVSCASANAFVSSIRFGDLSNSASRLGLGVNSEGGAFFVEDFQKNNNNIELADQITINGVSKNCGASSDGVGECYNLMKEYFEEGADGQTEKDQVCEKLYNQVRLDRNLEESTLRIRLCTELKDEQAIDVDCMPLGSQVGDLVRADQERDCSAFGFETPLSSIFACKDVVAQTNSGGGGSGTSEEEDEQGWWDDMLDMVGLGGDSSARAALVLSSSVLYSMVILLLAMFVIQ